jgi:hypothetical protein
LFLTEEVAVDPEEGMKIVERYSVDIIGGLWRGISN